MSVIASSLLAAASAHGGDARKSAYFESDGVELRWDNVEGPPLWVDGAEPRYSDAEGLHLVWLQPGKNVTVTLAPGALLRVQRPGTRMTSDDLSAWISDGSGLEVPATPLESTDETSLLFHSGALKSVLVKLARPATNAEVLRLALFTSRLDAEARLYGYRELISLPGSPERLWAPDWFEAEPYWRGLGRPAAVLVKGPADFALETRLRYPATEAEQLQEYDVGVTIDGKKRSFQLRRRRHKRRSRSGTSPPRSAAGDRLLRRARRRARGARIAPSSCT